MRVHLYTILFFFSFISQVYAQFTPIEVTNEFELTHVAPNLMGGGIGVIDVNVDGLEDLYFTGGTESDQLFLNTGDGFLDITSSSNIRGYTQRTQTTGVAVGDFNNDGLEDIFITTAEGTDNLLLENSGNNSFERVFGLPEMTAWSMGAAFGDLNSDGHLDIYVINYIDEPVAIIDSTGTQTGFDHVCFPNYFLLNDGNGAFTEEAENMGLADEGCGLAVSIVDVNEDGWQDIFIANDFGEWVVPNRVYINQNFESFSEESVSLGLNDSIYGMGIAIGDLNLDLQKDYYITNLGRNVFRQSDGQIFTDETEDLQVENTFVQDDLATGWGTILFDVDNDSYLDLYVSNGFIFSADFIPTALSDPNKLFVWNQETNKFDDESSAFQLDDNGISRGVITADLNNDGLMDLAVSNLRVVKTDANNESTVLINETTSGNWIGFLLEGTTSNKSAIGAKLFLYADNGNFMRYQEIFSGGPHCSSLSKRQVFGLSDLQGIDSVKVVWPDGDTITYQDLSINQYYRIIEGEASSLSLGCGEGFDEQWGCALTVSSASIFDQITLHPNPTQNVIYFNTSISHLAIYDLHGRLVFKESSVVSEVDISVLSKGIYQVKYLGPSGDWNSKAIIKN